MQAEREMLSPESTRRDTSDKSPGLDLDIIAFQGLCVG